MNGSSVAAFEKAFAEYVGADYAIALCNGTATLHTALVAMELRPQGHGTVPGERVAVPPLTMASTTIAVLHAGGTPVFADIDPDTWLMRLPDECGIAIPVSIYGLHWQGGGSLEIDDAAQTLRPHGDAAFTSYSFQASKVLPLGEGGMLVTNSKHLARRAREFSSLGYRMDPNQPRIDPATLKDPGYARHSSLGWNYRMSDLVAAEGVKYIEPGEKTGQPAVHWYKAHRREVADMYREAVSGCSWITPQHVPEGWTHDYWCYAIALESPELWHPFVDAIERHGGERPYAAWRLTYQEPAFRHLAEDGCCPVAEDLQPRLVQFQTNNLRSARVNADAVAKAIQELN